MDTCFLERCISVWWRWRMFLSKTNIKISNTNSKKDALFNIEYIAYICIIGMCLSPYNTIWLRCRKSSQENLQFMQGACHCPAKLKSQRSCGMSVAVYRHSGITSWAHTVSYSPWRLCFPLASSLHSGFFFFLMLALPLGALSSWLAPDLWTFSFSTSLRLLS